MHDGAVSLVSLAAQALRDGYSYDGGDQGAVQSLFEQQQGGNALSSLLGRLLLGRGVASGDVGVLPCASFAVGRSLPHIAFREDPRGGHGSGAGGAPRPYLWGTPVVAFHANFIATSGAKRECLNATGQWLQRPRPELCAVQSAVHRQRHRARPVGRLRGVRFVVTSRGSLRCVGA